MFGMHKVAGEIGSWLIIPWSPEVCGWESGWSDTTPPPERLHHQGEIHHLERHRHQNQRRHEDRDRQGKHHYRQEGHHRQGEDGGMLRII